ncbi:MAG TPA: ricin-type beta-trefoil lectin domain protein, partial [Longimicrobium sp.]|nr:ricin-type beta-trefoil lectin domain protein [Longimicrobium sp.]
MTYTWTISGGAITSAGGTAGVTSGGRNTITYTAGAPGTLALTCVERNSAGAVSAPATASVQVLAAPAMPAITAASPVNEGETGRVASVAARAGMTYSWTIANGTITSPSGFAGETGGGLNAVTYTAGSSGTLTLSCVEVNGARTQSAPAIRDVTVVGVPVTPVISAASPVSAGATGRTASVTARGGMTYTWTIENGTLTNPGGVSGVTSGGTNTITYTAGATGTVELTCIETNSAGASSAPGSASVTVVELVPAPVISSTSPVEPGATGLTGSVNATAGHSYAWTITNGTITSPGGAAGVTAGGVNTVTFTAGSSGTITLACVATGTGGGTSNPGTATVQIQAPGGAGHMYFVAHQDDDLLFINPAIEYSVKSGRPVQVVYETAGDGGGCQVCWEARENGVHNSYADMAGVEKAWTCAASTYAGKPVRKCTLTNAPQVSLVFMRLPDGGLASLWSETFGPPFWVGPVGTLSAVDGTATYTKAEVIQTVAALINDFAPARVGTLDSTFAYGEDHGDHITSALFALAASHYYATPHELQQYRGYNIDGNYFDVPTPEVANLSAAEYAEKVRVMETYAGGFPAGSDFDNWCRRNYGISRLQSGTGPLATAGGACLEGRGGSTADGTPVDAVPCTGAAGQRWTVTVNDEIRTSGGKCLTVAADRRSVQISACAGAPSQKWTFSSNGQIRSTEAACLTDVDSVMEVLDCDADRSTSKYTVLGVQRFTQTAGPSGIRSAAGQFSNADLADNQSYWGTLRLGDVNGDHAPDACVRREDGVSCALNDGAGGFGPY